MKTMPGGHFADLLRAGPVRRALGAASGDGRSSDLSALLAEVVAAADSVLSPGCAVLWLNADGEGGLTLAIPDHGDGVPAAADGLAAACLASREALHTFDTAAEPRYRGSADAACGLRSRSLLSLPLLDHGREALGVLQVLRPDEGPLPEADRRLAHALAAQCQLLIGQDRLLRQLRETIRLEDEIEVAREIQMSMLPAVMPELPGYDVCGRFVPAERAGGDLFDLVVLGGELFVLLGDATGHGFGPALSATQMQAMLRVAFRCGAGLDDAYRHVNDQLEEDLPDDRFITAFMGFLDPASHELRYHSGGQAPILHFHADGGRCEALPPTTFPLGALALDRPPQAERLRLAPGDLLALLSDGIFEYRDAAGEPFGLARVEAVLRRVAQRPAAEIAAAILDAVRAHGRGAPQADDITIVLLRRDSGGAS